MSTATLPRLQSEPHSFGFVGHLRAVIEGITEGHAIATRYERLARLSNSELTRLGLTRTDLPRAAVDGLKGF